VVFSVILHFVLVPIVFNGKPYEVEIAAKEILYLKNQLNHWLAEFTGQPLKRIEADTERDFYMSAQEAKAYGIVDKVVNCLPSSSRPQHNSP
jgi:ATP-dependent Clp protease, protease subunit